MTAEISVERLTSYNSDDAAEIGRLMSYISESFSGEPVPEELLRAIIESDDHDQLVARISSRIVGCATLSVIIGAGAGRKGWLEDFVSDPEAGQRGIGQALWNEIEKWCQERGVDLHFTSRPSREAAHNFYLKNGAYTRETTAFVKKVSR